MKKYCEVSGAELPNNKIKFEWEELVGDARRSKVFGGWVLTSSGEYSESMVFISDPNHEWEV